jgi:hypothetical protein
LNYILRLPNLNKNGNVKPVDSSILESLLTLIDGMLKAGAMVNARIIVEFESKSKGGTLSELLREYSAYAIVQGWMIDVWQALVSSKARSKATLTEQNGDARLNYALAEKMCLIEQSFKSSRGVIIARNIGLSRSSGQRNSASKVGARIVTAPSKNRNVLQTSENTTGKTSHNSPDVNKKIYRADEEKMGYNQLKIPTPNPSPWLIFRDSHTNALGDSDVLSPQQELKIQKQKEEAVELRREKRWEHTPRLKRIELLEVAEREMALKLARAGLSPKDERQLLTQMRKLGLQKQSKIMECVNALKGSGG